MSPTKPVLGQTANLLGLGTACGADRLRSVAFAQTRVFEAAKIFAQTEGVVTAPESAHGLRYAIDEALRCRASGEHKVIVFNNCRHGLLDLGAYDEYNRGALEEWEPGASDIPEYVKGQ